MEKETCSKSSSFFDVSLLVLPVPLSSIQATTSSFTDVTTVSFSLSCTTTFVTAAPFVSAEPDLSHEPFSDLLDEQSRKRKREHSGWRRFLQCWINQEGGPHVSIDLKDTS